MSDDLISRVSELNETIGAQQRLIADLNRIVEERRINAQSVVSNALNAIGLKGIQENMLRLFIDRPWVIGPRDEHSWFLYVPQWVPMQVGWLDRVDKGWNIFVIDRYSEWLGTVPDDVKRMIGLEVDHKLDATVDGPFLKVPIGMEEKAWTLYRQHLTRREKPGILRIASGQEFALIANLVKDGILPFQKNPINPEDLTPNEPFLQPYADTKMFPPFKEKPEQTEAWNTFLKTGSLGIFWPPGFGKMFLGLKLLTRLKGPKLVIVPTLMLMQEWQRKLKAYLTYDQQREVTLSTYVSASKYLNKQFTIVVFDECQALPANTYIKMSTLRVKYRVGLSASPYREDGRQDLIFALTGYPLGLDWTRYITQGLITPPETHVLVCRDDQIKERELGKIIRDAQPRTMVYCDWLELGGKLAKTLNVPFVNGSTKHGLHIITTTPTTVVSKVADVGIDITDLRTVVEYAYLFGSRRQEIQRFGRLLHSRFKGDYWILMTLEEYAQYNKRLFALYEKGFRLKVEEINT